MADDRWFTFNAGLGLDAGAVHRVEKARAKGRAATQPLYVRSAVKEYFFGVAKHQPVITLEREGAGEDGGAARGDDREGRQIGVDPGVQEPVDDLVDGAVTAEGHHDVEAVVGRLGGKLDSVAAVGGLDHVELHLAGQRVRKHVARLGARGGRFGVHDEESPHSPRITGR